MSDGIKVLGHAAGPHPRGDFCNHMMRREGRAFLPADSPADIISGKEYVSVGLMKLVVSRLRALQMTVGEGAETVRNRWPRNIHRLCQQIAVSRMEFLYRPLRSLQLGCHRPEASEGRRLAGIVRFEIEPRDEHPMRRKQPVTGVPDKIDYLIQK